MRHKLVSLLGEVHCHTPNWLILWSRSEDLLDW